MKNLIYKRLSLTISLVLFVTGVMLVTFIVGGLLAYILQSLGIISLVPRGADGYEIDAGVRIMVFLAWCIFLGTTLTGFMSKKALNPIRKVITATHQVAHGDFTTRVHLKGIGELEELSLSFNKMVQELANTETLRSDFINNFSHEFKTPIVSIRGFAKLLKEDNLTPQERQEYLDIIITESQRLADLSTNILQLSKYENLEIITDKVHYQLDEQIRRTIVLLEPKWSAKKLNMNIDLNGISYLGNRDLMQHIWINLIENAIKFSRPEGNINVSLTATNTDITFVIEDEGEGIARKSLNHIFDQFYQGDTSHAKMGNGLGLPLVKRVVDLCGGLITVHSSEGKGSRFTVQLPAM